MLREEYGHSYRQCPVCKKEGLPPGVIVCCQNLECSHVIDTKEGKDLGILGGYRNWIDNKTYNDFISKPKEEEEEKKKELLKGAKNE